MKFRLATLAVAVALYCSPAFAQHGHSGSATGHMGGGGGMGPGNGHVMTAGPHGNSDVGASSHSMGSVHGKTMDQLLTKNTALAGKIKNLTGMEAQTACDGFKNLGQCVAAAHVSKNLNVGFDCLKSDMTGQAPPSGSSCPAGTGDKAMSLGKSIQTLSPNTDSKSESKKAEKEADQDLKSSS